MAVRRFLYLLMGAALVLLGTSVPLASTATAAGCVASSVTDPMNVTIDPSTDVKPWSNLKVSFGGSISGGHCAGDSFSFTVPTGLAALDGAKYPMKSPSGAIVAWMTVSGQKITVTLTDFVETHENVTLSGWFDASITSETKPGESWTATWDINKTTRTPITMGDCPGCTEMPTTSSKNASVSGDTITARIRTATAKEDGQTFGWTDTVGAGQAIVCPTDDPMTVKISFFTHRDEWGRPIIDSTSTSAVTSCTTTEITGTFDMPNAGQAAVIHVSSTVSGEGPWTDNASVTTGGVKKSVQATAVRQAGGGEGNGDTPSPSPTTTTSTTTPPTSTTSTTMTTTTSSTSPVTSPSTSPSSGELAYTGTNGPLPLGLAALALLVGGASMLVLSRRRVQRRH